MIHTGHPFAIRINGERLHARAVLQDGDVIEHDDNQGRIALRLTYRKVVR
jgi:hypothetical protein